MPDNPISPTGSASPTASSDPNHPHGISRVFKKLHLVSKHDDSDGYSSDGSGKGHQRNERHRQEREAREERVEEERRALEARRKAEDEQARQSENPDVRKLYGELNHPGEIVPVRDITALNPGEEVTIRARIHTQRKISAALDFLLFRDQTDTIQGVLHREAGSKHMIKWTQRLPPESIVQVTGTLQVPREPVTAASVSNLELCIHSIHLVRESHSLPFDLYHEDEEPVHKRLGSRIVDLRHPANQAVFRIRSKVMQAFRAALDEQGFIEISTPKLQPAATESGAEVFKVNYFGRTAFLAQSPQLAKQMAISADFGRVFEVSSSSQSVNAKTNSRSVPCSERRTPTRTAI